MKTDEYTNPNERAIHHLADGSATRFAFPFIVWRADGLLVYLDDKLQGTDRYTVTGLGEKSGGNVVFVEPPGKDARVSIIGNTSRSRAVEYNQYITLTAKSMNLDTDVLEAQIQELSTDMSHTILAPKSEDRKGQSLVLPSVEGRKEGYLAFDSDGEPVVLGDAANVVAGLRDTGSTPDAVMVWADDTGLQAADSKRIFGQPGGAATLNGEGVVPDEQLPKRGHSVSRAGQPIDYQKNLDFSDEFNVYNENDSTKVETVLHVLNLGDGLPVVRRYDRHGEFTANTLLSGTNVGIRELADGGLEISAMTSPEREYHYTFDTGDWSDNLQLVIPPELHGLGPNDNLFVSVRDSDGEHVQCGVKVSNGGLVTITANVRFAGMVSMIGAVITNESLLVNPMHTRYDLIVGGVNGRPERLPLGMVNQVLGVNNDRTIGYRTLGDAAWKNVNIPGGVPVLDSDNKIPEVYLPYSTMTFKGTFGSATSGTGGDLPTQGVLDGDIYVCDMQDYESVVAGRTFQIGEWAIYSGTSWGVIPSGDNRHLLPVGTILAFTGTTVPEPYMACNGYVLSREVYPDLFRTIGTTYNTGSVASTEFAIPNYNNNKLFLQGATTPGTKYSAGLPNITGTIGYDSGARYVLGGCFRCINENVINGATGSTYNNDTAQFSASYSSAIYGKSSTVQPPSQTVVFIIKYQ